MCPQQHLFLQLISITGSSCPPIGFTPAAFYSILVVAIVVMVALILLICYVLKNRVPNSEKGGKEETTELDEKDEKDEKIKEPMMLHLKEKLSKCGLTAFSVSVFHHAVVLLLLTDCCK
ncbi:butyrophilin subfamily 3 member A2-like, partial [Scomber scombrus]